MPSKPLDCTQNKANWTATFVEDGAVSSEVGRGMLGIAFDSG
jgi:hypothetical protein